MANAVITGITMGGLLDKANATKTETEDAKEVKAKVSKAEEVTVKVTKVTDSVSMPKGETFFTTANPIGLGLAGLGFILMWFLDNYWFEDITGPIPFGLVVIGIMAGSFYLVWNSIDRQKTVVLAVAYLLLTSVPYLAGLELGGGPIGISELSVSEESDELSFVVRGSFSSATGEIFLEGEMIWSETLDLNNDRAKFSAPLSTIFMGNAQDHLLNDVNAYTITVTSNNDQSSSIDITPALLNREVENSAAKIIMRTETDTTAQPAITTVSGVTVESLVGMFSSSASTVDGGGHSMSDIAQKRLPISSDYTIQLKILKDGSQTYESPLIEVHGLDATWVSPASGGSSGSTNGWLAIPGTAMDDNNLYEFIERDEFFSGDDCYNFQVIVSNDFYSTMNDASPGTGIIVSDNAWELNFDSQESNSGMETCTP